MLPFRRRVLELTLLLLASALLLRCGGGAESSSEWTVVEGALTLEEDLLVSETDAFYFGSVTDVGVGSDGRMFVLDAEANHVKVLRPDGTLIDSIGTSGQGPGEFEGAAQIALARGDSLYVFERRSREISVFTPAGQFVRDVPIEAASTLPEALMVPEDTTGFVLALASFPAPQSDEEGVYVVQRVDGSGAPGDTIVTGATREVVLVQKEDVYLGFPVPFDSQPEVALGPAGQVHFGETDSLGVDVYSLLGVRQSSVSIPFDPVPITEDERTEELEDRSSDVRSQIADAMPESKPAFRTFLVDDEGRYWFRRQTAHADSTDWWVADPEKKFVATARLPSEIYIETVRDGFAYGETDTEAGAPALVRYDVSLER